MKRIDLHIHSSVSLDGEYTPSRLAALLSGAGLDIVSLTDHNSVRGVAEMSSAAETYGIRVIPGIELDCTLEGIDLHLLGYGINIEDGRFGKLEQHILGQKSKNSRKLMDILHEIGIFFDEEKVLTLSRDGIVVGETVAEAALLDERNRSNPLMEPYYPGGRRSDNPYVNFFWDYCSQGKPAFCPVSYPTFEQAHDLIAAAGGLSVIAHPSVTVGRSEPLIRHMAEYGVTGIEVYSSYHTREDISFYQSLARRLGLLESAGSDFHGKTKPGVIPGGIQPDHALELLKHERLQAR